MRKGRLERGEGGRPLASLSLALLVSLFMVLTVLALHYLFTRPHPGANDFYIPWRAVRSLVVEGRNPYSAEVTHDIQKELFGHSVVEGQHQFSFAYPLYIVFVLLPFVFLPYSWAQAFWQTALLIAMVVTLLSILRLIDWRATPLGMVLISLWGLFIYPTARALLLGQVAVLVFAVMVGALWALATGHEGWAGALLAVATLKPQMVFLFIPLIVLRLFQIRSWRGLSSFGITLTLLFVLPMTMLPTWPLDFMRGLARYQAYTNVGSAKDAVPPVQIIFRSLTPVAGSLTLLVTLGFMVYWLWEVWRVHRESWAGWNWLVGLTLVVTSLVAPRTSTTNQIVLLWPLLLWLGESRSRLQAALWATVLFFAPWYLFFQTVQASQEQLIMFLPFPFFALGVVLISRWHGSRRHKTPAA